MEKEFVPYEIALELKKLGFDKPCLAKYITSDLVVKGCYKDSHILHALFEENEICEAHILVPTFSQAFRWFREKYDLHHVIHNFTSLKGTDEEYLAEVGKADDTFSSCRTYEEAELECLKKLIEIVKQK
jgi:hypothetical protein